MCLWNSKEWEREEFSRRERREVDVGGGAEKELVWDTRDSRRFRFVGIVSAAAKGDGGSSKPVLVDCNTEEIFVARIV
tara:strand:+ start:259 stop:492 length:234 start_codon:yes stop_codon:yes gene_type:complete